MNYLAHIFLSDGNREIQFGNFIADAVKGNSYSTVYPQEIADGILLHRAIDSYTDNHPLVKETKQALKPLFGRYSAVLLDIYFDYLLASRFDEFSTVPLNRFARRSYMTIVRYWRYLPERMKGFMWHFIGTNRLGKYATKAGIGRALQIMVDVHRIDISVARAMEYLSGHEEELWVVFRLLFGELQALSEGYVRSTDRAEFLNSL